jgi:hypothetical protein
MAVGNTHKRLQLRIEVEGIWGGPVMCPVINCDMFGVGDGDGEPPARAIVRWSRWIALRSLL